MPYDPYKPYESYERNQRAWPVNDRAPTHTTSRLLVGIVCAAVVFLLSSTLLVVLGLPHDVAAFWAVNRCRASDVHTLPSATEHNCCQYKSHSVADHDVIAWEARSQSDTETYCGVYRYSDTDPYRDTSAHCYSITCHTRRHPNQRGCRELQRARNDCHISLESWWQSDDMVAEYFGLRFFEPLW